MFERFTEPARRVLFFSRAEATAHGQLAIAPEHLLLGMLRERGGRVHDVLSGAQVLPERLRSDVEGAPIERASVDDAVEIPFSPPTKAVLQYAAEEADRLGNAEIAPEHLLLGVLREDTSPAASTLKRHGLHLGDARMTVMRLRQQASLTSADDLQALHEIRERMESAENALEPGPIIAIMADDVVFMVPNEPTQEGRVQCAAFIGGILADLRAWFDRHIAYVSAEVSVRGDTALDRGTFSFTAIAKHDGRRTDATGKYLWLYTRTPDGWKLSRAIVSLDDPPEKD